jgi:hypothetical protein
MTMCETEEDDDAILPEDFAFTAGLLRQHMNTDLKLFQAVCSNNLSIILAALDAAAESRT